MIMSSKYKAVPYLPVEIVEIIIDYLYNDKKSLAVCGLVAHSWLTLSRYHFVSSITIQLSTANRLLALLDSPHSTLASSVRELKLISPNFSYEQDIITTLFKFTKRFTHLNSLVFVYIHWTRIDLQSLDHLRTLNITKLVMFACNFESNAQLFDIVSLFQVLEEFSFLSIKQEPTSDPYLYPSTISPHLRKLSVVNERRIPQELTQWLTHKPLPLLQDMALEEISCLADVQTAASLIAHTGPTLKDLHVVLTRGYVLLPASQPFLDLNCCPCLRTLSISLDVVDVISWTRSRFNISFLPRFIASATSSSLNQVKLVLKVGQMVDVDLRRIPWKDLDTVFASDSSFASLRKVVIELHPGYIFSDPVYRGEAEVVIYAGLERIARRGKLDVQYPRESPPDFRFLNMHRGTYRDLHV